MSTTPSTSCGTSKRTRRSPGNLPPPPPGLDVLTRDEAAAFLGMAFGTFGIWERQGRVTIPRYRASSGTGRAIYYARADLERLREEFRKLEEPHPDPDRPGVYRVVIHRHKERLHALIDAEDLPKVVGRRWNVTQRSRSGKLEVILATITERNVPLKRIIMGVDAPECQDQVVDYVNGDPLDCRRANLVIKTRTEVVLGRPKAAARAGRAAVSKYKGVDWDGNRRLWRAQIGSRGMHRMLGRFRDEAEAAAAYDAAAREIFGDAALLNFPGGVVPPPTFLGPDGEPVREKNPYRVPRGLPTPPPGAAMLTYEEAADVLGVADSTFRHWILDGDITIPRYRAKDTTGAPILHAAADIDRLREQLDKVGQPYPDPHPARAGVVRVPLRTLKGYIEALIDAADLPLVHGRKWNFCRGTKKTYDKGVVVQVGPRGVPHLQLKRLVLGLQDEGHGARIIHANGNPLDCRRENLVLQTVDKVTRSCFKLLHRCGRPTTSRFKGVAWNERAGGWQSQIRINDQNKRIGLFDDEEDAALAYDEAAREAWGAEARVNFPEPGELPSAAAPVNPADLWHDSPAARLPGKPTDFTAAFNADGSVTLSWKSTHAAASAGVTFAVSRKLPGQTDFVRIGTAGGTTSKARRPSFTDATVPAASAASEHDGTIAEYRVQGYRGTDPGEPSDTLAVKLDEAENPVSIFVKANTDTTRTMEAA